MMYQQTMDIHVHFMFNLSNNLNQKSLDFLPTSLLAMLYV